MPFFIPVNLITPEYFKSNSKEDEKQSPYSDYMDFAFFAVNFGYSRADYDALTLTEKAFIIKAYENKVVNDSTFIRNAVLNAVNNAFRKKGKQFIKLWKKQVIANKEEVESALEIVKENEKEEGKDWVALIYQGRR